MLSAALIISVGVSRCRSLYPPRTSCRASMRFCTCIGTMNQVVLVLVVVLETTSANRGRERRRGRRAGSWTGWPKAGQGDHFRPARLFGRASRPSSAASNPNRSFPPPQNDSGISAAEPERVAQRVFGSGAGGRFLHEGKGAKRVRRFKRGSRRQPLLAQRHQANDSFDCTRRAEQVADAGFGGTDR